MWKALPVCLQQLALYSKSRSPALEQITDGMCLVLDTHLGPLSNQKERSAPRLRSQTPGWDDLFFAGAWLQRQPLWVPHHATPCLWWQNSIYLVLFWSKPFLIWQRLLALWHGSVGLLVGSALFPPLLAGRRWWTRKETWLRLTRWATSSASDRAIRRTEGFPGASRCTLPALRWKEWDYLLTYGLFNKCFT